MQVRSFTADTEREALAQAKEELGDDFMIVDARRQPSLGNEHNNRGQAVVTVALERKPPSRGNHQFNAYARAKAIIEAEATTSSPVIKTGNARGQSVGLRANQERLKPNKTIQVTAADAAELFQLRNQLRSLKAQLRTGHDTPFQPPFDQLYQKLLDEGVPHHIAESLITATENQLGENTIANLLQSSGIPEQAAAKELVRQISYLFLPPGSARKPTGQEIVAVVGPSGAGKTSLIAKLASHKSIYRDRKTAIISTDIYRAGANAGLQALSKIISVPVIEVKNNEDCPRAVKNLANYDVILVDTPGRSPLSGEYLPQIQTQLALFNPSETILTMSANMGLEEMWLFWQLYQGLNPTSLAVTKLDETRMPGKILGLMTKPKLPLKFISFGHDVPGSLSRDVARTVVEKMNLTVGSEQQSDGA